MNKFGLINKPVTLREIKLMSIIFLLSLINFSGLV